MLLIIDQKLNYADARIKCSDLGSQLVEFQDEYEYDQVILHYRQVPYTVDIGYCDYHLVTNI